MGAYLRTFLLIYRSQSKQAFSDILPFQNLFFALLVDKISGNEGLHVIEELDIIVL